jgi:hypothetical protein
MLENKYLKKVQNLLVPYEYRCQNKQILFQPIKKEFPGDAINMEC